jgi:cell division septum initiation protein DivIVA
VQERADLLGREAEEDRSAAASEASRVLDAARAEAAAVVGSAKEHAERIRRDSERELAAATARRDSITAQLSNVRNMLGTLGGGAAVGLPAEEEHSLETTAAPADEASAVEAEEHAEVEAHDDAEVEAVEGDEVEAVDGDEVEAVDGDDATDAGEPAEGEESPESEAVVETPKPSKAHARR